jgi:hypothetical protein
VKTRSWREARLYPARVAEATGARIPGVRGRDDGVQDVWVAVLDELPHLQHDHNANGLRAWFSRVGGR